MSLQQAILIAKEAIRLDNAGSYSESLQLYIDACSELLKVVKSEPDLRKKSGLKVRVNAYMKRAEQLKALKDRGQLRQPQRSIKRQTLRHSQGTAARSARSATNYFLPDAKFRSDCATANATRASLEARCRAAKQSWTDPSFKPGPRAIIGKWGSKPDAVRCARKVKQWLRPTMDQFGGYEFNNNSNMKKVEWSVYNGLPVPSDIEQGDLGDCWFLSAVAVLAAYPELIKRLLITTSFSKEGVYAVRLCYGGEWRVVMVDDWLPCTASGRPVFASPCRDGALCMFLF